MMERGTYTSEIVNRYHLLYCIRKAEQDNRILYTDEGKTLVYVPKKYSGRLYVLPGTECIRYGAFRKREDITEIEIGPGLRGLGDKAFEDCISLEKIILPASVERIGDKAFQNCRKLRCVLLSEGTREISASAFCLCGDLEELYFPSSLRKISSRITSFRSGLHSLHFAGMDTEITDEAWKYSDITLYGKSGSRVQAYAQSRRLRFLPEP